MELCLVRHPRPLLADGICYGQSDIEVDLAECVRIAARLRGCWPAGWPLYSSPLRRCMALAGCLDAAPRADARLMEMDFGAWEMQPWEAIARSEIDAWAADVSGYRPGGGESVAQLARRVGAFCAELVERGGPGAVIVCHAGSMRVMQHWRPGISESELAERTSASTQSFKFGECYWIRLS